MTSTGNAPQPDVAWGVTSLSQRRPPLSGSRSISTRRSFLGAAELDVCVATVVMGKALPPGESTGSNVGVVAADPTRFLEPLYYLVERP